MSSTYPGHTGNSILQASSCTAQERVLDFVENTLGQILEQIQLRPLGKPTIILKRITDIKLHRDLTTEHVEREILDREVAYTWPGKSKDEAWRFTCVGKILTEIYAAVKAEETITKRDIYYRDPSLYRKQNTVDRYVDDIAHTCGVTRTDLHVTASTKGLMAGLAVPRHDQKPQHGINSDVEIVPDTISLQHTSFQHIKWILVIEKEAVFHGLVQKRLHRKLAGGRGLMLTGKGYPDLATRRFLRAILDLTRLKEWPLPPILGLFDCDPDGIDILRTYQNGSIRLAHEMACNLPEMIWVGVELSDVLADTKEDESLIPLTLRDRKKATAMLERQMVYAEDVAEGRSLRELQKMLMLNVKAEMQALENRSGGLEAWIKSRILQVVSRSKGSHGVLSPEKGGDARNAWERSRSK